MHKFQDLQQLKAPYYETAPKNPQQISFTKSIEGKKGIERKMNE